MTTILQNSLKDIAAALASGQASSRALLSAAQDCHRRRGAVLGAYMAWHDEMIQHQAEAADLVLATGGSLGPLQGIPVSVKDHFGVKGFPTYAGTRQQLPAAWEREGPVVSGLRRQLAVLVGKTVAVELAFGGIGLNHYWGSPRNPWDGDDYRVSGGSSSGAGVSLWEGSALLALGTDTGGSVRIPASMTGTVGLKTTFGRWSLEGIVPLSTTLDTPGILTRSVADAAFAFAAMDPAWGEPAALERQLANLNLNAVRIGTGEPSLWSDCDPGIVETVDEALDSAMRAGAQRCEHALPEAADAIHLLRSGSVVSAECDAFLETELPAWRASLDPIVTARISDGGAIPVREYLLRRTRIQRLQRAARERFQAITVVAAPTVPITPPRLAEVERLEDYRRLNMLSLRNTCVANFLGLCALTLPVGLDRAGMPVGLMLMAPGGTEETLLGVGLLLERVLGNARERLGIPPLCRD
jgi:aspartyl-tRNA(Asn)/glutamyl-tRNA(Gln) amidotransferase subunit A